MSLTNDQKRNKVLSVLKRISNKSDLEIGIGGKENYKLKVISTGCTYPLAANHPKVKLGGIKYVGKWLEKNKVCTYEEFESYF